MDNHNAMWHGSEKKQQVVLDNVWITHIWEIRVFLFCCHVRCITGIYIFHYNLILTLSVSLYGQVQSPNDGPFFDL